MNYCYPTTLQTITFSESHNPGFNDVQTINQLGYLVASVLNLPLKGIRSKAKVSNLSEARFIIMHIAYHKLQMTLAEIGKFLNRDHSTITWGLQKFYDLMDTDKKFKQKVMAVKSKIV